MTMLMDTDFSLVRVFGAGHKVECSSVAVLFFPSPRFFPLGFSWEGFLRRQDRLAVYTPIMLLRDDFEVLCTVRVHEYVVVGPVDTNPVMLRHDNYYIDRRVLWSNLVGHAGLMRNRPWVLLGDFNAALNLEDHSSGGYEPNIAMRDFKDCVQAMDVRLLISGRIHFTLNQKPKGSYGILKRLIELWDGFREIVESGWNVNTEFFAMYHVVKRLKGLKSPFYKLLHEHGNLHERVNRLRVELDEAQKAINMDPSSSMLHEEYAHYLLAFKEAQLDEERFLKIEMFFGVEGDTTPLDDHDLYMCTLDNAKANFMAWDVVGGDITCAIHDFFSNGKLLKELNHTSIALIPKLMRNYHRKHGPPRCAFKVDIQKAYDTIDWKFLENILVGFGFHPKMVHWIMVCVSGASYSICVNVMEVLTLILQRRVCDSDEFQYHHLCEQQRIINLCFADGLFLFARGHPTSFSVIMDALDEFKQVSGLVPSIPKSTSFFCNVPNAIKASILNSMPFAEVTLSV
ncbi:sodium/hydrogen exchanger 6, partial [Tanacetum coccineum]